MSLYNNAAQFGQFEAKLGLFIGVIVAISSSACGVMSIVSAKNDKHTAQTSGKLSSTCTGNVCTGTVTYSGGTLPWMGSSPAPSSVNVWYDPKNPSDATLGKSTVVFGLGLIGAGLCLVLLAYLSYWIAMRYKVAAAAQGAAGAANIIGQAFR